MTPKQMIEMAAKNGYVEIQSGVYLWSQGCIISEQKLWDKEDKSKKTDFTKAPYWITDNDGLKPIRVFSEENEELNVISTQIK